VTPCEPAKPAYSVLRVDWKNSSIFGRFGQLLNDAGKPPVSFARFFKEPLFSEIMLKKFLLIFKKRGFFKNKLEIFPFIPEQNDGAVPQSFFNDFWDSPIRDSAGTPASITSAQPT